MRLDLQKNNVPDICNPNGALNECFFKVCWNIIDLVSYRNSGFR